LDNTIRVQRLKPTNWVLCDIRVDGVNNGFGHGSVFLWAQDGTLLATASQSAVLHNPRS
jgi:acyl-CoA thioesterase